MGDAVRQHCRCKVSIMSLKSSRSNALEKTFPDTEDVWRFRKNAKEVFDSPYLFRSL